MLTILWTRSLSLFQQSWNKLGCNAQDDWCRVRTYFRHSHVFVCWKRYGRGYFYIAKIYSKANTKHEII